jgi:hypothetical protein
VVCSHDLLDGGGAARFTPVAPCGLTARWPASDHRRGVPHSPTNGLMGYHMPAWGRAT